MSQSHIIPLTGFAKLLAKRGVTVSIITTPSNAKNYNSSVIAATPDLRIQLITVRFPGQEVGLPQGCENMDALPSLDLFYEFFRASDLLRRPLEAIVSELRPKPSCIVSTNALPWTQDVADKFDIPRYIFSTVSCFSCVCSHIMDDVRAVRDDAEQMDANSAIPKELSKDETRMTTTFVVPRVPDHIEFGKDQLVGTTMKRSSDKLSIILRKIKESQDLARGSLINTFEELEPWYVSEYKKLIKTNAWCVGPVSLRNKDEGRNGQDRSECLDWLDSMKQGSIVYACFGSLCQLSLSQLMEIGLGLEASGSHFVWVIRGLNLSSEVEKWLEDEGFEERVRGKGLVVRGWAPQVEILSHPSIGGFLTHCGWNSTLEGVCAGVPMVTFPMFAEQFSNEKLITDVLKIGEKIGVEESMSSWDEEKNGVLVRREQVKNAIDRLMGGDRGGDEKRKRAQEFAKMAKDAGEEGGSSFLNVSLFIQDVMLMQQGQEI
ncbi:unnamed protein product [Cuscuta campestris]|uniref:Glycosyltransferase n=1 Tax=Cuscuta campestris TaxID=132261 RepID=A0A484LG27_9ASTE|nr:unnamed protein product [Cuscuta campestris]